MSTLASAFSKSIGRKLVMALTGLFLVSFLFVHLSGNFQLLLKDEGTAFNVYTKFMTTNPIIRVMEIFLLLGVLLHVYWAFLLTRENAKARPIQYAVKNNKASSWASRNMGLLGAVLLLFLVVHVAMFWGRYHFPDGETVTVQMAHGQVWKLTQDLNVGGKTIVHEDHYIMDEEWAELQALNATQGNVQAVSMYKITKIAFANPLISLFYIVCLVFLSFHLMHGFQSAFRSLGLVHKKYTPLIENIGKALAFALPLGFATFPILMYIQSL